VYYYEILPLAQGEPLRRLGRWPGALNSDGPSGIMATVACRSTDCEAEWEIRV
jgi:hypothetical protein